MTDKEKSAELTLKLEGEIGTSSHSRQAIEETLMEIVECKNKQHPHWNKQEENDIYFAINPSIKEQRDLLLQKMEEAGYE